MPERGATQLDMHGVPFKLHRTVAYMERFADSSWWVIRGQPSASYFFEWGARVQNHAERSGGEGIMCVPQGSLAFPRDLRITCM